MTELDSFEKWISECPLPAARLDKGITWYDLARRAGLTQAILIKWAEGAVSSPRLENVQAVAVVLGDPTFTERFYSWIESRPPVAVLA